ncbi:hypothetical protein EON63_16525 [archaeon]|nr:MAG: hypothetical protein EON63_16525 [archaeon]
MQVNQLDNRASNFYVSLYWAEFMAMKDPAFTNLAAALKEARGQIVTELKGCQGMCMVVYVWCMLGYGVCMVVYDVYEVLYMICCNMCGVLFHTLFAITPSYPFPYHTVCTGKSMDVGGYYKFDAAKASAAMRPSKTLNAIIDSDI